MRKTAIILLFILAAETTNSQQIGAYLYYATSNFDSCHTANGYEALALHAPPSKMTGGCVC